MSARQPSAADAPSPSPSAMPPNKRPRPAGNAGASGSGRTKRAKKVEEPTPASDDEADSQKKGREGEDGEPHTKIDFRDLPDDTLYKYLEMHSLLPVWFKRPWDEKTMQRPRDLYHSAYYRAPSPSRPAITSSSRQNDVSAPAVWLRTPAASRDPAQSKEDEAAEEGDDVDMDGPSTRSKTAPQRQDGNPAVKLSQEVFTLSDVQAARDILAERANQHWVKGLGGGQNKESETIVNFLYKLKVGPGRLLKVYNPTPSYFPSRV